MITNNRIVLSIGESSFSFDTFTETFGTVVSSTPAYSSIYRVITGTDARRLVFGAKVTKEQAPDYEALRSLTGSKQNMTVGSTSYSGYALESVKLEFRAGALMGDVTAVFSEVS